MVLYYKLKQNPELKQSKGSDQPTSQSQAILIPGKPILDSAIKLTDSCNHSVALKKIFFFKFRHASHHQEWELGVHNVQGQILTSSEHVCLVTRDKDEVFTLALLLCTVYSLTYSLFCPLTWIHSLPWQPCSVPLHWNLNDKSTGNCRRRIT